MARAWAIKELFRDFWTYQTAGCAKRHFVKWYSWAIRSRLDLIKAKARMIKTHLPNLLTYFMHGISNAVAEGLNSKIEIVKSNARGYRSFAGFRNRILFYCGGLELAFFNVRAFSQLLIADQLHVTERTLGAIWLMRRPFFVLSSMKLATCWPRIISVKHHSASLK